MIIGTCQSTRLLSYIAFLLCQIFAILLWNFQLSSNWVVLNRRNKLLSIKIAKGSLIHKIVWLKKLFYIIQNSLVNYMVIYYQGPWKMSRSVAKSLKRCRYITNLRVWAVLSVFIATWRSVKSLTIGLDCTHEDWTIPMKTDQIVQMGRLISLGGHMPFCRFSCALSQIKHTMTNWNWNTC